MRDLNNLNKEHDNKGEKKMEEKIYSLGEIVYTRKGYRLGKYAVVEIIRKESVDGTAISYTLENPFGQKSVFTNDDGQIFSTFEEARKSALLDWEETDKQVRKQFETLTEEKFNEDIEKQKADMEAKRKLTKPC